MVQRLGYDDPEGSRQKTLKNYPMVELASNTTNTGTMVQI
jgi:hypothetical protein